jgi:hypothetical protein
MSQILVMAKCLQEAEEIIAKFEATGALLTSPSRNSRESRTPGSTFPAESIGSSQFFDTVDEDSPGGLDDSNDLSNAETSLISEPLISDLSLDENGKVYCSIHSGVSRSNTSHQICWYGPTSAVHDPPNLENQPSPILDQNQPSKIEIRSMLTSNAMELRRSWEEFALGNLVFQSGIPRATISNLLQIHWSWIAPMFMWIYRPAFMRKCVIRDHVGRELIQPDDMTTDGPYFSQYLLVVLCAHAARFQEG